MLRSFLILSALTCASCFTSVAPVGQDGGTDVAPTGSDGQDVSRTPPRVCFGAAQPDNAMFSSAAHACTLSAACRVCVQHVSPVTGQADGWKAILDADCICPPAETDGGQPSTVTNCDARTTYQIDTRAEADAICASETDCMVCVQDTDASGQPTFWSITLRATGCTCAPPNTH